MTDTKTPLTARLVRAGHRALQQARWTATGTSLRDLARHPITRAVVAPILLFGTLGGFAAAPRAAAPPAVAPPSAHMADLEPDFPLRLLPALKPPAKAPRALAKAPMQKREVFGFVPYWTLDEQASLDVHRLTTLSYFGVDVAADGSIIRSGNGWVGYESNDLAELITRAHKARVRAVLTVKAFNRDTIHSIVTNPRNRDRFAHDLIEAIEAKRFDGANIDLEGTDGSDRVAFTSFVRALSKRLHQHNPAWQVTVDTYVSSAQTTDGLFDIAAMVPAVDAFFIMGYDMYQRDVAASHAPLPRYRQYLDAYLALAPASKLVLGTPFYGYDWQTTDNGLHSKATSDPTPVPYETILSGSHPRYWDATASVPWTAYQSEGKWHEIYYEDPSSLSLKARLANEKHLRGTGAWALGMDGNDDRMLEALLGKLKPMTSSPTGPATTAVSVTESSPKPKSSTPPRQTRTSTTRKSSPTPTPSPSATSSSSALPLPVPSL